MLLGISKERLITSSMFSLAMASNKQSLVRKPSGTHPGNFAAQHRSHRILSPTSRTNRPVWGVEKPTLELEHAELALIGELLLRVVQQERYRDCEFPGSVHGVSLRGS